MRKAARWRGCTDAVGMEAHGSPGAAFLQKFTGMMPDALAEPLIKKAGVDRIAEPWPVVGS